MDAITKKLKRKVYSMSHGFTEEEIPVTFREFIIKDYTKSDLIASSIYQEIIALGRAEDLFTNASFELLENDFRIFIAETTIPAKINKDGDNVDCYPKVLGVAVVQDNRSSISYMEEVDTKHINFLVVDEKYRKMGIAENLLDLIFTSMSADIPTVSLNVEHDNAAAINLYEKLGFRILNKEEYFDEMYRINIPEFQVLANIASKGIEYVYMNCSRKDITDFFENIETNSKIVNSNRLEIKSLKDKYPSAINLVRNWVLDFEKFRSEQPENTFSDFMESIYGQNPYMYTAKKEFGRCPVGIIKNSTVYKKCERQASGLGKKIIFTISERVKSDITVEKYGNKDDLKVSRSNISGLAESMGFE